MLFTKVAASLAAFMVPLAAAAPADANMDLGSVLSKQKNLTTFYGLVKKYPDILLQLPSDDGITILAPSDAAFKNIPGTTLNGVWDEDNKELTTSLLQYHLIKGTINTGKIESGPTDIFPTLLTNPKYTNVTTGQNVLVTKQPGDVVVITSGMGTRCTVVKKDIEFSGGVIQMIDNLLIPPSDIGKTADAFKLESFLGGLYASKLMPGIGDRKSITVFAPSDIAIEKVAGNLEKYNASTLQRVFGYHIVPDQILVSSALQNGSTLPTLAKDASNSTAALVNVAVAGNNKYINSAQLAQPDILLGNGILHILSSVLNPDATSAHPDPAIATQPPAFPLSTAQGAFTSAIPCTTDCPVTTDSATGTGADATAASTSSFSSSTSSAGAPVRTAHVAGAALGALGLGAILV